MATISAEYFLFLGKFQQNHFMTWRALSKDGAQSGCHLVALGHLQHVSRFRNVAGIGHISGY